MSFSYNQVTAITHDLIKNKMTEGVFKASKFLSRLREKQDIEDGGNKIICPLMTEDDTGTTGEFYSPRDQLSLDEYDGISASEHDWKYIQETVVVYKADIAKNSGRAGVLKLVDKKVRQGELAMRQRMSKGVFSDGTAATGALTVNQYVGLQKIIQDSGSYGGISPADLATWVATVLDNGGADRALTLDLINQAKDLSTEEGIGGPTLGIMTKEVFTKFKGLLDANQRTMREDSLSGQGHKGLEISYMGIPHIIDNNMPAQTLYYVDENHFKLHVQKDNNMRRQSISDLETADALLERIFCYSAVAASERKFHASVEDITI
jgi:hypothetical protein